jgi:hypothetical protein
MKLRSVGYFCAENRVRDLELDELFTPRFSLMSLAKIISSKHLFDTELIIAFGRR